MNPAANPDPPKPLRFDRETSGVILILLTFVLVNLLVATRTPTVFCDEPGYTDPAANLYLGSGFTSTMWGQDRHAFWCGNVPLYQGILYCFFKLMGFGLFQVRAVGTFLAGAGALLIWAALRQSGFIRLPTGRLMSLALILSGSVSTLTFRTARYDATMFFICAAVFYCCSLPAFWRGRLILIALCSALLPAAGVPMLPYVCIMGLLNLAVYGFANFSLLASMAAGMIAGVAALVAFYHHFSSWHTFLEIVLPFTGLGGISHSGASGLSAKIFGKAPGDDTIFTCFFGNPAEFLSQKTLFDYSAALLFLLVVLVSISRWSSADHKSRKFMLFMVAVTLCVPPLMHLAGHYRSFYRWMTYVPLAIAVPWLLEMQSNTADQKRFRRWLYLGMGISFFMGIPLRTLAILPHWAERSTRPLERVAAETVQSSDVVVCSYKAYFAIRPRAKLVYAYGLPARGDFSREVDLPAAEVTLLCLYPEELAVVTNVIGGHWEKLRPGEPPDAEALAQTRYAMDFYRRSPDKNQR